MDRRTFISTAACSVIAIPLIAHAQQPAVPVVGFLTSRSPEESAAHTAAFRQGLSETGYIEAQNVAIEYRWAKGHYERLPALASELVRLRVSVVAAVGGERAWAAAVRPACEHGSGIRIELRNACQGASRRARG